MREKESECTRSRQPGTREENLLIDLLLEDGEGLVEHGGELADLLGEGVLVLPGLARVKHLGGDALDLGGDREVEGGEVLVVGLGEGGEGAVVDGVDDGTSVLERAARAGAELAADPAGVDEPAGGLGGAHALGEHGGVARGVEDDEGSAVAGGEGRDGLEDTVFGTGSLGGIASEEVVAGLLGGELGDGRENTVGVAGEHDDVLGLAVDEAGDAGVGDVLNGVGAAGVLGDADVVVVGNAVDRIVDDVLEDGSEADGGVDLGLLLGGEVDALGVATTLDVEDTLVGPDVLVVTDELTSGIGRQGPDNKVLDSGL